jgi:uncharacterized membrane protein
MQTMRLIVALVLCFFAPVSLYAEQAVLLHDVEKTYTGEVVASKILDPHESVGAGRFAVKQELRILLTSGDKEGQFITITNSVAEGDTTTSSRVGDKLFIKYMKTSDGSEYYSQSEPNRLPVLMWLTVLFILVVIVFGGKHGVYAILALIFSFGGMFSFLLPRLLEGYDPVVMSLIIAMPTLFVVMYFTHGFNRVTTSAYIGCVVTVVVTVLLAKYAVIATKLSGFADEESVYLDLATGGALNFQSLLTAAIIIGIIGVVDDIAITQASVVAQLRDTGAHLSRLELYKRAMKVGKDHSAALINTLVFAYAGTALPILLLIYTSQVPILELINREVIATEIVRTIVGSIGLVALVPCATAIAVYLIRQEDAHGATGHHNHAH